MLTFQYVLLTQPQVRIWSTKLTSMYKTRAINRYTLNVAHIIYDIGYMFRRFTCNGCLSKWYMCLSLKLNYLHYIAIVIVDSKLFVIKGLTSYNFLLRRDTSFFFILKLPPSLKDISGILDPLEKYVPKRINLIK